MGMLIFAVTLQRLDEGMSQFSLLYDFGWPEEFDDACHVLFTRIYHVVLINLQTLEEISILAISPVL